MPSLDPQREWFAHRFASQLPRMTEQEFSLLLEDIRANGMQQPIVVYDGKILDGRNRLEAARQLRLARVPAMKFSGTLLEAWNFVVSANIVRRRLNGAQAAMAAARMRAQSPTPLTQEHVAALFNISARYVRFADSLLQHQSPLAEAARREVDAGRISLRDALHRANNEPDRHRERAPSIDPMPDNPALAAEPAPMSLDERDVITHAARAVIAANGDPTTWAHGAGISAGERYVLATALEEFARRAADILAEELGAPNAETAAQQVAQRGGSLSQQHRARADALAARQSTPLSTP